MARLGRSLASASVSPRWCLTAAAVIVLYCASTSSGSSTRLPAPVDPVPTDRKREMIAALAAAGPHPSLGDQARVFDRFVGTWECGCTHFAVDGGIERYHGELKFGWIIDGRAIQDIWIGYPSAGQQGERSIGTSIRFFDQRAGVWQAVWIAPEGGVVATVKGGAVGDRIVLEGENADGSMRRWSFNEIRPDSFVWLGESSHDRGRTWRVTAEYRMTRRGVRP